MDELDRILGIVEDVDAEKVVESVLADNKFDVKQEVHNSFKYNRKVSVNEIVPEAYQQKLMEIEYTVSQCYWLVGDITADLVDSINREKAQRMGKVITKQDIFEAVGMFCHRSGRSVRYYYECAHYFPIEVRQKYDVPFSFFAEARWISDWELYLNTAMQNPMWSVEKVRTEYDKLMGEVRGSAPRAIDEGAEVPDEKDEFGEPSHSRFKAVLLSELEHNIDSLRRVMMRMTLPQGIIQRIGDIILDIENVSMDIRREM